MVNFEIEKEYISDGFNCICGVDEAGRGPLAGPVPLIAKTRKMW